MIISILRLCLALDRLSADDNVVGVMGLNGIPNQSALSIGDLVWVW